MPVTFKGQFLGPRSFVRIIVTKYYFTALCLVGKQNKTRGTCTWQGRIECAFN